MCARTRSLLGPNGPEAALKDRHASPTRLLECGSNSFSRHRKFRVGQAILIESTLYHIAICGNINHVITDMRNTLGMLQALPAHQSQSFVDAAFLLRHIFACIFQSGTTSSFQANDTASIRCVEEKPVYVHYGSLVHAARNSDNDLRFR